MQQRFTLNSDNTVTDSKTGLTWQQKTLIKDVKHQKAEQSVALLGDGWRLPTVDELFTLVDHTKRLPAIDTEIFLDTENDWYWTSTSVASHEDAARWVVYFDLGYVYGLHRDDYACVRAVRSGQKQDSTVPHGALEVMGNIQIDQGGELQTYYRALVITFDSNEAIRAAIDAEKCTFGFKE